MIIVKPLSLSILRVILSVALFLGAIGVHAQQIKLPLTIKKDSVRFLQNIAVGVDVVGVGQLLMSDYGQYEAYVKANIKDKYFPVVEIGYGKAVTEDPDTYISYNTKAPYGRIGVDFNVSKNKHDIYRVFAGVRYGFTSFKYNVEAKGLTDPIWQGSAQYVVHNVNAFNHWGEAVFGLDAKIWGALRMGWTLRYRRRIAHKEGAIGTPWYIPGFGRGRDSVLGGSFNVAIEL